MSYYPAKNVQTKQNYPPLISDQKFWLINEYLLIYLFFSHCNNVFIFVYYYEFIPSPFPCVARCPDQLPILGGRI